MWEHFWTLYICSNSECSTEAGNECSSGNSAITNPDSCINNILVIAADILLLFILLSMYTCKLSSKKVMAPSQSHTISSASIISVTFNAGLALAYFGFGIWTIVEKVNADQTVFPLHGWLALLFQGFTWLLLVFFLSLNKPQPQQTVITKSCSILGFLIAVFLSSSSIWKAIVEEAVSVKIVLNIFYFPGSIVLLFTAFQGSNFAKGDSEIHGDTFYKPLQGAESDTIGEISSDDNVTPFAKAGLCSSMSFWWLNSLRKKGKQNVLENEDIPQLRQDDQARMWYLLDLSNINQPLSGLLHVIGM